MEHLIRMMGPVRTGAAVALVATAVACGPGSTRYSGPEAVRAAMEEQVRAWNQGDIPGFMAAYADSACFITVREHTCGKEVVAARYAKAYPDRAAMGHLDFSRLELLPAGPDHAWCTGNWRLERSADTLSGGFSLLWARTSQGWRILRDHTY